MNELTSDEKLKIQTNLEYIGLDLNNIPQFIKIIDLLNLDLLEALAKIKVEYINI